jgi:hypothetical protein
LASERDQVSRFWWPLIFLPGQVWDGGNPHERLAKAFSPHPRNEFAAIACFGNLNNFAQTEHLY